MQAPLQPLQDNLESATYETFEKDTTKYTVYQRAIHAALLDCTPQEGTEDIVVMVVGAGRGPLVTASLKARGDCIAFCTSPCFDSLPELYYSLCVYLCMCMPPTCAIIPSIGGCVQHACSCLHKHHACIVLKQDHAAIDCCTVIIPSEFSP